MLLRVPFECTERISAIIMLACMQPKSSMKMSFLTLVDRTFFFFPFFSAKANLFAG